MLTIKYKVLPHNEIHEITFKTLEDKEEWIKRNVPRGIEIIE